jgi:hypothetical protein
MLGQNLSQVVLREVEYLSNLLGFNAEMIMHKLLTAKDLNIANDIIKENFQGQIKLII